MRGWMVAMALVAGAAQAGQWDAVASGLCADSTAREVEELKRALAEREAAIQQLEERLARSEQARHYAQAEALGVTRAVRASRLPERQQRRLATTIVREAERNGLDPMLVVAVIRAESSFNVHARSPVGALGLMQVMPATGQWLLERRGERLGRDSHLYDADLNVELGTAYLAELIGRFGSLERALVAYNAGPTAAHRILASADRRTRFLAGYPRKVVREFHRLKSEQQAELSRREATPPRRPAI